MLSRNKESVGTLLRGFFEYFSHEGNHVVSGGFHWGTDVLSLRTLGGLVPKRTKGWTGAKTTIVQSSTTEQESKEIRHRYLFAIEDPFEIEHNVARTVTHSGICAIRNEFRRAWRIIGGAAKGENVEDILKPVEEQKTDISEGSMGLKGAFTTLFSTRVIEPGVLALDNPSELPDEVSSPTPMDRIRREGQGILQTLRARNATNT
jgi:hypothetical protein